MMLLLGSIAWSALAFGAVYPWAYRPLLVACGVVGVGGFISGLRDDGGRPYRALQVGLAAVWIAVLLQVIPLPPSVLARVSPATDDFLRRYDVVYAAGLPASGAETGIARHPLSIEPEATWRGLGFLTALAMLFLGTTRLLSRKGATTLVYGLTVFGAGLAVIGIVQRATFTGRIYGFWTPQQTGDPFGPFVNKNHFAGWMMMAAMPAIGLCCAGIARGMRDMKPGWRNRLLWLASPVASRLIFAELAVVLMGLSLVLSLSRSGIAGFAVALVLSGVVLASRQTGGSRRNLALGHLVFVLSVTVAWAGVDAVARRFTLTSWTDAGGRSGTWRDAGRIVRDFPLTGTGLNTYGSATLLYETPDRTEHFGEAHNDYLQLVAEGGLLLGVPIVVVLWLFAQEVRRRFRERTDDTVTYWVRVGATTGLVAMALQEMVDFSLQIPANAVLFVVLAAIAAHRRPRRAASGARSSLSSDERPGRGEHRLDRGIPFGPGRSAGRRR